MYSVDFYKQIVEELFDNDKLNDDGALGEETAKATGNFIEKGATIMGHFLRD